MGAFSIRRAIRLARAQVRKLLADRRASGDLTTYMLLTAAGAVMVGLTVPSLFQSSDTAARTFRNQVNVLERGANPSGGGGPGGSAGGSGWTFNVGKDGVSVSGPGGSVSAGNGGVTGNVGSGGGGSGSSAAGKLNLVNGGQDLNQGQQNLGNQQQALIQ